MLCQWQKWKLSIFASSFMKNKHFPARTQTMKWGFLKIFTLVFPKKGCTPMKSWCSRAPSIFLWAFYPNVILIEGSGFMVLHLNLRISSAKTPQTLRSSPPRVASCSFPAPHFLDPHLASSPARKLRWPPASES